MGVKRMLRELDSEEITDQMAFDIIDAEDAEAQRKGIPAPTATPPTPAQVTDKLLRWRRTRRGAIRG